ncbi:hypothetical protein RUM44_010976 [Polyplax serrata]|uniref:Poly(A)-specific ribonuclease RNA-binding domain-containing protein n=1 Tax=Polyplax serrata TaxID=468196 RepID=A0ABR1AQG7_POLSC
MAPTALTGVWTLDKLWKCCGDGSTALKQYSHEGKMEVTRENFNEVIATLEDVFKKAAFLTFDTEFTGLRVEGATGGNYFDTLDDLYVKDRFKAETFMAIQYGITAFIYDNTEKRFTHQAYNFYVFPSDYKDMNFTCQTKSITFLIENGFDFNKLFGQGIPYLKDSEVEKLLENLSEKQYKPQQFQTAMRGDTAPETMAIVKSVMTKIEDILESNSKETFVTEKYNSFLRRHIYCAVQKKYGFDIFVETNKDKSMTIAVGYSEVELKELQVESYLKQKHEILEEAGFTRVIKLIMESKKLLVGHNLLADILFTIQQFLTPLPNSYSEFKELVNFLFPKILDTKYLVSTMNLESLKDTSLSNIIEYYENAKKLPQVEVCENGQGYHYTDKKYHQAAYDSYMTGLAFLSMLNDLGLNIESLSLQNYVNKLSVRKMHDISYMNIGGKDAEPDRRGVYHLTFPKDWKRDHITGLFKNCGFVNISWINNTSAFIKVKSDFIKEVETTLMNSNSNYKLCTYAEFRNSNVLQNELLPSLMQGNKEENFTNNDSIVTQDTNDSSKKRSLEDIGEVIERPPKKLSVS